jgi:hypothetical protein
VGALLADATGFGPRTTALALVLLPVVLLLGIATYVRQVQINNEEFKLVLAPMLSGLLAMSPPAATTGVGVVGDQERDSTRAATVGALGWPEAGGPSRCADQPPARPGSCL